MFGVSTNSIWHWQALEKEQGHLKKRPLNRKHKKVDPCLVKEYLDNHSDAYAVELARHFQVNLSSILYILKKKLNYVRKKNSGPIGNETKTDAPNSKEQSIKNRRNCLYMWTKRV